MNEDSNLMRVPKVFDILIEDEDTKVSESFELDKTVVKVMGVAFASEKPDLLFHRGFARLEINKREFFPENHAVQRVMSGISAALDKKYWPLEDVIIGNGIVKIDFVDKPDGRTAFEAYTVQLYLDCLIEIE